MSPGTGTIYKLVNEADESWGAGVIDHCTWPLYDGANPNRYVINIEHEGYLAQGGDGALTEVQYQSTLWLHRRLIPAYTIPIDKLHIIPHSEINANHNCPGPNFPWARLFADMLATVVIIAESTILYGQLINGSTWGPMADVCNAKGIKFTWDAAKRIMCLAGASDANISATSGVQIVVDGQVVAGQLLGGSTWAPVAAMLKELNILYTWDQATRTLKF